MLLDAVHNPQKVSHLVLLSPWPSGAGILAFQHFAPHFPPKSSRTETLSMFANILGSIAMGFQDADLIRIRTEWHTQGSSPQGLIAYNAASQQIDLSDILPKVSVPALVIHERPFPFGSFQLCQEVAAGIPGAEFVIVNNNSICGRVHNETVAVIDQFLRAGTAKESSPSAADNVVPGRLPRTFNGLTAREREVLQWVTTGATNKEIASRLGMAVSTVERHLVNLYPKIGARGRADAITFALRNGLDRQG